MNAPSAPGYAEVESRTGGGISDYQGSEQSVKK